MKKENLKNLSSDRNGKYNDLVQEECDIKKKHYKINKRKRNERVIENNKKNKCEHRWARQGNKLKKTKNNEDNSHEQKPLSNSQ